PYLKLAKAHDCQIEAIFFDVPVEMCQRRNRKRDRVVPEEVIEKMAKRLQPPSLEEGFDRVALVNSISSRATGRD
ncbi:MAG TPA: AAA family ATPase, partial [Pirellulales bacterium]|nr:AAA family ATPase [Pirellulales bacterium]